MLALLLPLALVASAPVDVAVTVDDLPFLSGVGPQDTQAAATDRLLASFHAHQAPVTGFVNCGRASPAASLQPLLARWIKAGAILGNHSQSHLSVDAVELNTWLEDVQRCDKTLVKQMGKPVSFFRYPFLQEGRTAEKRDAASAALSKRGYQIAQVSIDTSDWALVEPYLQALRAKDTAEAHRIGQAFIAHVLAAARHYREEARRQAGRDIKHILLLHAHALSADWLGPVLAALRADGFRFISLPEALKDPIYQQAEQYTGGIGLSWLYRIAPGAAARWRWDETQSDLLQLRFSKEPLKISAELSIRKIAPQTYVVVHQVPHPANSLVAEMPDGRLLLVGSPYEPESTQRLAAWLKQHFPNQPWVAVNTHSHFDGGSGGNETYLQAGAKVYGSDLTAQLIRERGEQLQAGMVEHLADKPLLQARFKAFVPQPPTQTFTLSQGLTLTFDSEEVLVRFPGQAHAPDNVVVWFPARQLLFGGCAVVAMPKMGFLGDANLNNWPAALDVMRGFHAHLIVPGHEAPGDGALLNHTLGLVKKAQGPRR